MELLAIWAIASNVGGDQGATRVANLVAGLAHAVVALFLKQIACFERERTQDLV
jgi:hypothetical protein